MSKMSRIKLFYITLLSLGTLTLGFAGWWFLFHPYESTDNTYLKAHMTLISPRESGYVKSVLFENNQKVRPGDLLVVIDDADFKARVAGSEAQILVERSRINRLEANKQAQKTRIDQQNAEIDAVEADLVRTEKDLKRFRNLAQEGAVSTQTQDAAEAAQRDKFRSARLEAESQLTVLDAHIAEAEAQIRALEAALDTARIALSHTRIVAPMAGTLGNRSVQVGELVKPGSILAYLIPDEGLYVEANFKETQITDMAPGQVVDIHIDAFPDMDFMGQVESFAPASGSEFSLLPPENASGNFTKIVRRVPVKILFNAGADLHRLRPGLSATAKVRVR
jgi:membrane fusion protein (multidrug efflux system)